MRRYYGAGFFFRNKIFMIGKVKFFRLSLKCEQKSISLYMFNNCAVILRFQKVITGLNKFIFFYG